LLKEIVNVVRTTKLKHVVKAMKSPSHSFRKAKYHYRRVPEKTFITFFATQLGHSDKTVDKAYMELDNHRALWEEIGEKLSIYPNSYGSQMTRELSALYLLVRLLQPNHLVETGVSAGVSSAYILAAMEDNDTGKLHSIDLPPDNLPNGKKVGWVVPDHLKNRWSLYIGDALDFLEPVLSDIGTIDCFIHDSLHTYEHMTWEFRTAWNFLCNGGLFLSHDVGANEAFFDFMEEKGIAWKQYRVFHVLGGFKKFETQKRFSLKNKR
jgi:predicted O-methyltransferase YrrM